ncbi:MAG: c-type cytochrome [Acidobacteria bacterium]|nr:c-type cytochrome [Acidobacteriota bacterium]
MRKTALALLALAAVPLAGDPQSAPDWPPPVQKISGEAPALPVQEALKTFFLPPGYKLELVAAEPLVSDPIVMDQDADGRLWVVEMPAFAIDESMQDSKEPINRVVVLEDEDDDGLFDKRTVFADNLVLPRAIKVLDQGVLIGEPPNLWLMKDSDGDLKADSKELVRNDFGRANANIEHNANGLYWGMDNTLYTSEHDWNLRWKDGKFLEEESLVRGQWNLSQDDAGRIYRNWNEQPLFADIVPVRYFVRNPNMVRTRGLYDILIERDETAIWPVRPTPGLQRAYRQGFLREDGTATTYASSADPYIFRGDRLPKEVQGGAFVADSPTNLVHWLAIEDDGTGRLKARDGYEKGEIVASTDERFRPVNLFSAADGTLYIIDMYRGVVQDIAYQTEYLNTYIKEHDLALPVGLGRIYRLAHESLERGPKPSLSQATPQELVRTLSHPNGWWRDTAQQLLVQRKAVSVAGDLKKLAVGAPDWRTKLHALWTLDGLDSIDPGTVEKALGDRNPDVRAAAIRISERWLRQGGQPVTKKVLATKDDPNWIVRRQLAASLGELPQKDRAEPLVEMLRLYGDDPITVDAAISGLAGQEPLVLDRLLSMNLNEQKAADVVTMLAATIARSKDAPAVSRLADAAGDSGAAPWRRQALLAGLAMGLPSGKLSLAAEPKALASLGGGSGADAEAANEVIAKLDWPGKPAPPKGPALTAAERERVAAGEKLYTNFCAGCHLANGEGNQGGHTNLAASKLVAGSPAVTMRVVLNGKEGEAGLMPPLGGALDDDQVAAVISYIRNAWGRSEFPISGPDVQEVRGESSLRKQPWTDAELVKYGERRFVRRSGR